MCIRDSDDSLRRLCFLRRLLRNGQLLRGLHGVRLLGVRLLLGLLRRSELLRRLLRGRLLLGLLLGGLLLGLLYSLRLQLLLGCLLGGGFLVRLLRLRHLPVPLFAATPDQPRLLLLPSSAAEPRRAGSADVDRVDLDPQLPLVLASRPSREEGAERGHERRSRRQRRPDHQPRQPVRSILCRDHERRAQSLSLIHISE